MISLDADPTLVSKLPIHDAHLLVFNITRTAEEATVLVGCRIHEDEYVAFLLATGFSQREFGIQFRDCAFVESKVIGICSNESLDADSQSPLRFGF